MPPERGEKGARELEDAPAMRQRHVDNTRANWDERLYRGARIFVSQISYLTMGAMTTHT
jgi:hypothetical protein